MNVELREQRSLAAQTASSSPRAAHSFTYVQDVRLIIVALWLGAAVFFSVAVAPSAFSVLPSRELAGAVVGRTLAVINTGGFVVGLVLLASMPIGWGRLTRRAKVAESASLIIIAVTSAAGQWVISARLAALRALMGQPIDMVAKDDPLRVAFGSLHAYSVAALSVGMIAAAIALLLIGRRVGGKSPLK